MADITTLILADHDWFREQFARLDEVQARNTVDRAALQRVWRPLADKLDVHAYIEEKIFYPQLLQRGVDGAIVNACGLKPSSSPVALVACSRPAEGRVTRLADYLRMNPGGMCRTSLHWGVGQVPISWVVGFSFALRQVDPSTSAKSE